MVVQSNTRQNENGLLWHWRKRLLLRKTFLKIKDTVTGIFREFVWAIHLINRHYEDKSMMFVQFSIHLPQGISCRKYKFTTFYYLIIKIRELVTTFVFRFWGPQRDSYHCWDPFATHSRNQETHLSFHGWCWHGWSLP